ncbi:MAG: protein kinase [Holophaga sp.]|nr:protein kinase [Holophaga sp.]
MSPFTGTDRFAIRRRLGSGQFGVVYEAFDFERQTLVALKLPHDSSTRDISLFKQEFRALAEITHPNLVNLYEVLSHGSEWFFTMERVEGKTFYEYLCPDRQPPRNYGQVRALLRQMAEGLWALHQTGRLHRDLKPSHVRIDPLGRVVFLDFGFTAEAGPGSTAGRSPETQAYMAPERIGGHVPTEAGDWYSVGVMLYEVLTGTLPFPGGMLSTLIDKMRGSPPSPELLAPRTPGDLSSLCMDLLARKPGARPSGSQILARLGVVPAPAPPRRPPSRRLRTSPLLIGRKPELAALGRAFEASLQGKTTVVFVYGNSGMGKSYLLRRFIRRLKREEPGTVVLSGRCTEEGAVPYKALTSLMGDLAEYLDHLPPGKAALLLPRDILGLARLFPVLQEVEAVVSASRAVPPSADPQELRRRAFGALRELLLRMGTRHPLVLVIEDLQWGDMDSAALLSNLLRDPDPPSMLVVLSYRTGGGEATPAFRSLQRRLAEEGTEVVEVPVEKIPPAESEALARALLGSNRPDAEAEGEWIAKESGGNPFFIGELSRHLRSGIRVLHGPGEHTLDAYILFRVASLPDPSRILLETLALAGHPVELDVARRACGIEAGEEVLTPLRAGHLISARGQLLEPYHDRIRQSVLRGLPEARARALHLALAEAMEQAPQPDAQALCLHFQAAGARAKAGEYALKAAEQAVTALAFVRAAEFYRRGLHLKEPKGAEYLDILLKLGDALASAGLGNKAAQVYLEALPLAPVKDSLRLQRRASEEYFRSGRFDQGEAALGAVMERIGMNLAQTPWRARLGELWCRLRLRLRGYGFQERTEGQVLQGDLDRIDICWAAAMGLGPVDHIRGGEFQARHLLLALHAGEPFRIVRALALETIYVSHRGNRSAKATQKLQDLTLALAERIGHPNPVSRALVAAGTAALMQGRWKAAVDMLERAETLLKDNCTGLDYELHQAQFYSLLGRQQMGSLRDMEIRLSARIQAAQDKGDLLAMTNLKTGISPQVHLAHDEPARALRELQQTIGEWSSAGFHLQHFNALVSRVEVLLYDGDPEQALAVLGGHWQRLRRSMLLQVQAYRVTCLELRARAALALVLSRRPEPGRRETLLRSAYRDMRRIEKERVGYGDALALRLQALEALAQDRPDEGGALLFQAELAFQACGMALHAMVARHRRGRMEGPSGAEQVEAAERWMRGQKIVNPTRFVAMHLPG